MSATTHSIRRWIAIAVLTAVAIAALAVVAWPASATDKARDDGERVGQAAQAVADAESYAEAEDALTDLRQAIRDTRIHAGDAVADQAEQQEDALSRAVDGYVGELTTDSDWDAALYEAELDVALDDLAEQADDFQTEGPEVEQAFWEGVDSEFDAR